MRGWGLPEADKSQTHGLTPGQPQSARLGGGLSGQLQALGTGSDLKGDLHRAARPREDFEPMPAPGPRRQSKTETALIVGLEMGQGYSAWPVDMKGRLGRVELSFDQRSLAPEWVRDAGHSGALAQSNFAFEENPVPDPKIQPHHLNQFSQRGRPLSAPKKRFRVTVCVYTNLRSYGYK